MHSEKKVFSKKKKFPPYIPYFFRLYPEPHTLFYLACLVSTLYITGTMLFSEGMVKLREEYLASNEETKRFLEKRYGKATIQQALEESFSNEWLQKFSKQCPSCGFHIQVSTVRYCI